MKPYYLLFDVGGTEIKINALTAEKEFLLDKHQYVPSYSQETKEVILAHFRSIISQMITRFKVDYQLAGIGLAFPGPFDYQNGISLMQGLRKYEEIYGVNLRENIQSWLTEWGFSELPIVFENDATCFALGEYHQQATVERGIYITLGTGCGSSLIANQKVVKSGYGLNQMGMIYDVPFKEGIIDEYLSINGLKKIALAKVYPFTNGKELADAAFAGQPLAKEIFQAFGTTIGEGLASFVASFSPNEVVFGGQISKSMDLFESNILNEWTGNEPAIRRSSDTTTATLYGIYYVILDNIKGD